MSDERHEEHESPRIKVTDRRLFDRDGNPREPDHAPEVTAAPAMPTPAAPASPVTPPAAAPPRPAAPTAAAVAAEAPPLQVTADVLLHFLEEQYMMAMIALGAMPHPQTGKPAEDLDMAHLRIEMLDALRQRTEGHRPPEASQALDEILYRLRMTYLQKRKVVKI